MTPRETWRDPQMSSRTTDAPLVYLGLGSNQGDRIALLRCALFSLLAHPEISVRKVSRVYETEHVGARIQKPHLNACIAIVTPLAPRVLLAVLKSVEQRYGRRPGAEGAPRPLDLDILLFGNRTVALPELTIPHPRLRDRAFVLVPLREIAPEFVLPDSRETVAEACAKITGRAGPWVRLHDDRLLTPAEPGGAEEDWRAALAVHCR
jgi:2-amino-4-hydroxy-6-hydroxymethyldihydropteridine diphosphokinase